MSHPPLSDHHHWRWNRGLCPERWPEVVGMHLSGTEIKDGKVDLLVINFILHFALLMYKLYIFI